MKKTAFPTKRLAFDALLVALYYLLGLMKIPIGNMLRINMASFAVVICAISFGPVDGLIVGFLGEFLSQILGPYGLTPTTLLWSLPEGVRGLLLGFTILLFSKMELTPHNLLKSRKTLVYLLISVIVGIVVSLLNTFALYVDSKMFGYYSDYMVFGVLFIRLVLAVIMSGLFGYISLPIVSALRRNKII